MTWLPRDRVVVLASAAAAIGLDRDVLLMGLAPGDKPLVTKPKPVEQHVLDLIALIDWQSPEPLKLWLSTAQFFADQSGKPQSAMFADAQKCVVETLDASV